MRPLSEFIVFNSDGTVAKLQRLNATVDRTIIFRLLRRIPKNCETCQVRNQQRDSRTVVVVLGKSSTVESNNVFGHQNHTVLNNNKSQNCYDIGEIRTLALKEQWISNPSP